MSLLRLLTSGKSLIGLQDETTRYRMRGQGMLPRFTAASNPFRSTANSATNLKAPSVASSAEAAQLVRPGPAGPPGEAVGRQEPLEAPLQPAGESQGLERPEIKAQAAETKAPKVVESFRASSRLGRSKLGGWLKGLPTRPKAWFGSRVRPGGGRATARSTKPLQQAELSLDSVRVVRNDLSDCDDVFVRPNPGAALSTEDESRESSEAPGSGPKSPNNFVPGSRGTGPAAKVSERKDKIEANRPPQAVFTVRVNGPRT
jgi:hypothetical protein